MKYILAIALVAALAGCTSSNVPDVKAHAAEVWKQAGFEIVGYEGYVFGRYFGGDYGGGHVWHTVRRIPDTGVTYHGFIEKWGDEYHIYNITAIDAIQPK